MKKQIREQEALEVIKEEVDSIIFDISCGQSYSFTSRRETFVSNIYKKVIWGRAGKHFKFLTADWIYKTINEQIEKSCKEWGVSL